MTSEHVELTLAMTEAASAADTALRAGSLAGLQSALWLYLDGEHGRPVPPVLSLPARYATASPSGGWSVDAQAYSDGFAAGWRSLQAFPDAEWTTDLGDVLTFAQVLHAADLLADDVGEVVGFVGDPGRWGREFGVWVVCGCPVVGDGVWSVFVGVVGLVSG